MTWCGIHLLDPRHQHPPSDDNLWLCDQMIMITRCSEKDNTPQPLFSERIAHSWANRLETVRVSHWHITWPIYLPCIMGQEQVHYASNIVSNSHLFHSKSIDLPTPKIWLLKFDLENPRSGSWVRSKFKVITWVQHPIDSHPFGSISIHRLIPMIELFQNLTLKIQDRSQSSMSHIMYNNLSTHIPVIPSLIGPRSWDATV